MKFNYVVGFIILASLSTTTCYSKAIDLDQVLLDKKLVGNINWEKLNSYNKFSDKAARVENTEKGIFTFFGTISLVDTVFKLSQFKNSSNDISLKLGHSVDHKDDKTDYKAKVNTMLEKLKEHYGNNPINLITRTLGKDDLYTEYNQYQWTIDGTRIQFLVIRVAHDITGYNQYTLLRISYDQTSKSKLLIPIKFLSCSNKIHHSDGTSTDLNDFTLGVNYNSNIIVSNEYFENDFKLEGNFITSKSKDDKSESLININRTTGNISGYSTIYNGNRSSLTGSCVAHSGDLLF